MEFDEFTIALLVSGPTPNTDAFQDAHLAHLASLHDAGSLLAAGPLSDPAGELRGLSILNVPVEEAIRLKEADEAVRGPSGGRVAVAYQRLAAEAPYGGVRRAFLRFVFQPSISPPGARPR